MKTKYDWSKVPDDVKWIATDADGSVCGYSTKPYRFSQTWNCYSSGNFVAHSFLPAFQGNWKNSLEQRPPL